MVGTKVLGVVEGGTIELHGKVSGQYFSYLLISFLFFFFKITKQTLSNHTIGPSWTNLGATAAKGATSITLRETVSWKPGDRIVLASTDYNGDYVRFSPFFF